jgi:hypothetical protein
MLIQLINNALDVKIQKIYYQEKTGDNLFFLITYLKLLNHAILQLLNLL